LNKFKNSIKADSPVHGPLIRKNGNPSYSIRLCSDIMYSSLNSLGVIPNKTLTVKFPKINEDLNRHFMRGLFDGDGSIFYLLHKFKEIIYSYPSFSIASGVESFLTDIRKLFVEELDLNNNKIYKSKRRNHSYSLSYEGKPALKIRDWMYNGATVFMECKKEKFYSYEKQNKITN